MKLFIVATFVLVTTRLFTQHCVKSMDALLPVLLKKSSLSLNMTLFFPYYEVYSSLPSMPWVM